MKKMKRFVAAFAATTVLMSCVPSMAWADSVSNYTAIPGTNTTFKKYLVMDAEANIPKANFTYTISVPETESVANGNGDNLSVKKGILAKNEGEITAPTISNATFAATTGTTIAGIPNDPAKTAYKYIESDVTVNLAGINFTEPGVYRYYIEENEDNSNQGITYDQKYDNGFVNLLATNNKFRTLDVYVENSTTTPGTLVVQGYVLYEGKLDSNAAPKALNTTQEESTVPNGAEAGNKSEGYINVYDTSNITIAKKVAGNQASKDKYFKFTVEISDAVAGTKYDVDLTHATATKIEKTVNDATTQIPNEGYTNPAEIVIPTGETSVSVDFYLQGGQYIVIKGLAKDTKYTISEKKEDYTISANEGDVSDETTGAKRTGQAQLISWLGGTEETGVNLTEGKDSVAGTIESEDIEHGFLNVRNGVLPTGIIMSVAPAVIVGIGVLAAIFALVLGGKKKELDEE